MSLHSLKDVNSLHDPLKQFLCKFVIAVPPHSPFSSDFADQLELRAQSFNFPEIKGDATEVTWSGHKRQYAGKQTRDGEWTVKFTEVWSGDVIDGFKKWVNNYHNFKAGTISLFNEYATTIDVALLNPNLYDPKPTGAVAKNVRLYRAYPTSVKAGDINPSDSAPVEIDVTIHYDYFLVGDEID